MSLEWCDKLKDGIQVRPPATHGNRIIIQLHWDAAPIACENFATLCTNGNDSLFNNTTTTTTTTNTNTSTTRTSASAGKKVKPAPIGDCGKQLSYKNCNIHRCIPGINGFVQGGDFIMGNGSGGESIYNGKKFKDERGGLALKHDRVGVVSMGNSGKNSNTSQFFMTFGELPQCDGKHVVFGQVVSGFDVLDALKGVQVRDHEEVPIPSIRITDCGAFHPLVTPGAGYWYDQPDPESFSGATPVFVVRPRVAIVAATRAICDKFRNMLGNHVVVTPIGVDCDGDCGGREDAAVEKVKNLLESFAIDLVVVAPVYQAAFDTLSLPKAWSALDVDIRRDEIVIVSKPVEAMLKIRTQSWIGKRASYHLDGVI